MPVMALIKSKREDMNIINSIIDLGMTNEPCTLLITHDEEQGTTSARLGFMGADVINITWGVKQRKEMKYALGATSHGITQLYLHVHHNLIETDSEYIRDYFAWKRDEILENIKTLGIIYNGDEWWDKLKQSFFRLAISTQKSETLKVVMVLTSDAKEHKAVYTICTDFKLAKQADSGRTQLMGGNTRVISRYGLTDSPDSVDSILAKYTPEHLTAAAV